MKISLFLIIFFVLSACNMSTSSFKEGAFMFDTHCASCHGHEAEGLGRWYPPLKDTAYIREHRKEIPSWIRYGINRDKGSRFKGRFHQTDMPDNHSLQPADISNILNYLNEKFWHLSHFDINEVEESLKWGRSL